MIKRINIFIWSLLLLNNYIIGQTPPNVDNIFIGSFHTFDPYIVSEYQLKKDALVFNTDKIFFWIKDDTLESNINKHIVLNLEDEREPSFSFKLYMLDDFLLNDSTILKPGQTIFFNYNCRNYNSIINAIYYYEGWSKGYFASTDIPSELNVPQQDFRSPRFPLIGSLNKNMKIYLNRFQSGQYHDEIYIYQGYTMKSNIIETGQYGYFDSKIYDSSLSIEYQNKEILMISSDSKIYYLVGDLRGSSLISLYIVESITDGINHSIIEFSENKFARKSYFHESVD